MAAHDETIEISPSDLEVMLNEAAQRGALQALRTLGLHDDNASNDVRELRALLTSWREVRKSALQAVVKTIMTALLGLVLLGVGVKIGAGHIIGTG